MAGDREFHFRTIMAHQGATFLWGPSCKVSTYNALVKVGTVVMYGFYGSWGESTLSTSRVICLLPKHM